MDAFRYQLSDLASARLPWYDFGMSTDLITDWDAFNAFVDARLGRVRSGLSLEDALSEFRAYQRELVDARAKIREARQSSARGESVELDIDRLIQEVNSDLASEGICE
jgi:hypothetical protein